MLLRPPGTVAVAAAGQDLGPRVATYRAWRADPFPAVWIAVGAAVVLAVLSFLVGVPAIGVVLVPVAALGAAAYAGLLPPDGGRRWLVVYERGFVDVVDGGPPLAVRWESVGGPVRIGPDGCRAISVHPVGAVEPVRVVLDGLAPLVDLVEAVDQGVGPVVVARHLAAARAGERVEFGPLAVTVDAVERVADGDRLPWEQIESVRLVAGERIVLGRAGEARAWFSGQVPEAAAATGLIAALRPPAEFGGPGTAIFAPDAVTPAGRVRDRRRRHLASLAGLVVLALLPGAAFAAVDRPDDEIRPVAARPTPPAVPTRSPIRPSPTPSPLPSPSVPPPPVLPETIYGYSDVCRGQGFTGAARYGGRAPHPIHVDENFVQGPARWYSDNPAKIQIVACVQLRKGRVLKECSYFGDGKRVVQDMVLGRYTLVIREARTAKIIGRTRIDGTDADCLILLYGRRDPDEQQVSVPTQAQIRTALRRYVE
ncbi:hypothetical protein I0C86_30070 [Plantactinospora sp. S1510]|uniref:Uncharacterized protein n=1 Tax=Plantactinospora alkalitolerans TaxID=2789879 RepID=A0ABS0H3Z7_9ACTN|nr:hypothetical protein [Plantactinospora alkalitolerans]MBF9133177.1 hypothetical protein [Plantactinospora alkalitolerans]